MWFIGVEVKQETSAPPPKINPGSAPAKQDEFQIATGGFAFTKERVVTLQNN